jgi:hypothetical protein
MLFCWWRYDRRTYLKTWCCRCCFVDGDTIVELTLKLDVVDVVMARTRYFPWEDNDDIHFVLEQHAYLECYSVYFTETTVHECTRRHIILVQWQLVFARFCWWRYDRKPYLKTWCCRCCFVDGDTIVDLTLKLDVVYVVL